MKADTAAFPTSSATGTTAAAIIYLARSDLAAMRDLTRSLRLLRKHFLRRFPYPVIVFVEPSFPETWKLKIRAASGVSCRFETVTFTIPEFLDPSTIPEFVHPLKFNIGYRHMCRFFSGIVYRHPALKSFKWYWRLDTDSFLLGPVRYDVFAYMEEKNLIYGYNWMLSEQAGVVRGLWEVTCRHLRERNIEPSFLADFLRDGEWDRTVYYTNFEISDLAFWKSKPYQDFFEAVDRAGGIYRDRWGDAPIHALAVQIFVPKEKVHRFGDICYSHGVFVNYPGPWGIPYRLRFAAASRLQELRWQFRPIVRRLIASRPTAGA